MGAFGGNNDDGDEENLDQPTGDMGQLLGDIGAMVAGEKKTAHSNPLLGRDGPEAPAERLPTVTESTPQPPATQTSDVRSRLLAMGEQKAGELRPVRQVAFKVDGKNIQLADEVDELTLLGISTAPPAPLGSRPKTEASPSTSDDAPHVDLLGATSDRGAGQAIIDTASAGAEADLPDKRKRDRD